MKNRDNWNWRESGRGQAAEQERAKAAVVTAAVVAPVRQQQSTPLPPPPPSTVPPPPPIAPPVPPVQEKRETPPPEPRKIPPQVQKQLEDKKKREESHAALMAAVARRRNIVDSTDMNKETNNLENRVNNTKKPPAMQGGDSLKKKPAPAPPSKISQEKVKVEQQSVSRRPEPKKVPEAPKPPPIMLLPSLENAPEGSTSGEQDFLAMAEKARQEWLQKKATSPTNTIDREEISKAKKELKKADDHPKPKPAATARQSQSLDHGGPALANLASVVANRAQERTKTGVNANNNVDKKGGRTVIYRSGPASSNKASISPSTGTQPKVAPATQPKPNSKMGTTDWSESTVEIKGATVDCSLTELSGAIHTTGNKPAYTVNGTADTEESAKLSVAAKAKLFESSASPNRNNGVSPSKRNSGVFPSSQSSHGGHSMDDVPPPMVAPGTNFNGSSRNGGLHSWQSGGSSVNGSGYTAPTPVASPMKLAQLSRSQDNFAKHSVQSSGGGGSNSGGVAHMVVIPENALRTEDPAIDIGFIPPPPISDSAVNTKPHLQAEDTVSMASTLSTLSTLSSADPDRCSSPVHSTLASYSIAPPPPREKSPDIEIAPPPPGFDDSPTGGGYVQTTPEHQFEELGGSADFVPPPMEFDSPSPKINSSVSTITRPQSHSMVFPAVSSPTKTTMDRSSKAYQSKPIESWTVADVGDWLESIQLSEHRPAFKRENVTGQKLMQMGRSELIALGVTQVGHRMGLERAVKKAMMNKK